MLVGLLVNLIIWAIVLGLVWWLLSMLPIPPPFQRFIQVLFILICILVLLGSVGVLGPAWPHYRYGPY
jgi:heme A synthase